MGLWMPGAVRRHGPPVKVGYTSGASGPKRGDVKHSAEGGWGGIHAVLDDLSRSASFQFTVGYDRFEQHYPYNAHCWHAGDADDDGGVAANIDLVGIEHLGMAGTPLTDYQVAATVQISEWCAAQEGITEFARYPEQAGVWTLVEHNEVSDVPTACPSGRIPWDTILKALGDDDMTDEERRQLKEAEAGVKALRGIVWDQAVRLHLLKERVDKHGRRLDNHELVVPALHAEDDG
ncbi:hypothetical protein LCGC14_1215000 [marine sediment metagenome]|uniref:N-acetylmuramoyl-L-alanine amidase n=1 Tax=marine sediment metagenome TaxID=412755 RepID=A0A0F9LD69_9ZZZZ